MKEKFEFDKKQAYKLTAVTDRYGKDKSMDKDLYRGILHCTAMGLQWDDYPVIAKAYRMNMIFVQNESGKPIYRTLHTSMVEKIEQSKNGLKIHTMNSIYHLVKTELMEIPLLDAAELIELYMSLDDLYYFGGGFYYDRNKKAHKLIRTIHLGMFQDSVLVLLPDHDYVCRYFPEFSSVTFYDTLYNQQKYETKMLIHNTGNENLPVRFEGFPQTWMIAPGESKTILPYRPDGSDK